MQNINHPPSENYKTFKRVLVANRGEIAIRVFRALREQGIASVAIYSDADSESAHRKFADFAVRLSGNLASETYLNIPLIIEAATLAEVDAVHPGYGFLSENADFAEAVSNAGMKFIGPPLKALRLMGDKVQAKKLMKVHNVPTVPGSENPLASVAELKELANKISYPLILKAAAGGGGRGMRVVRKDEELEEAFAACTREAQSYFGNPAVFCERYLENPRHIEFQVMFDEHGNGVHLYERDCSIQRRHQKLIEEAPSTFLNEEQRNKLGQYAVTAASAAGYSGAGTIEFICESPEKCYFMEMNTRIQVEHTVTELITGIDLVGEQVKVAQGHKLSFKQEDVKINGWGFEARINAENPLESFAPCPGVVKHIQFPAGPFVRVDSYLYPGFEIPAFYDSMVAKLLVWGRTRKEACQRMLRALSELEIDGVPTTARFHEILFNHPKFREGNFDTSFLEKNMAEILEKMQESSFPQNNDIAAMAYVLAKGIHIETKASSQSSFTNGRENWILNGTKENTRK